jgi:hypothetical protein
MVRLDARGSTPFKLRLMSTKGVEASTREGSWHSHRISPSGDRATSRRPSLRMPENAKAEKNK